MTDCVYTIGDEYAFENGFQIVFYGVTSSRIVEKTFRITVLPVYAMYGTYYILGIFVFQQNFCGFRAFLEVADFESYRHVYAVFVFVFKRFDFIQVRGKRLCRNAENPFGMRGICVVGNRDVSQSFFDSGFDGCARIFV